MLDYSGLYVVVCKKYKWKYGIPHYTNFGGHLDLTLICIVGLYQK